MSKLIVLCGIPGSGKSTYANKISNELWNQGEKTAIISTDFIREYLFGNASCQLFGNKVFTEAYKQIEKYLDEGYCVIFDAMNLRPKDRHKLIEVAKNHNVDNITAIHFSTPVEVCIERQLQRERQVPEKVIRSKQGSLVIPSINEGFDAVLIKDYISD